MPVHRHGPKVKPRDKRGRHRRVDNRKAFRAPTGKQIVTTLRVVCLTIRVGDVLTQHDAPAIHWMTRAFAELVALITGLTN